MRPASCGIVLAGGESRRLTGHLPPGGKLAVRLAGRTVLERVCRRLAKAVERIIVVAAPGQMLPVLPDAICVVRDSRPGGGPLAGLADGLRAVAAVGPGATAPLAVAVVAGDVPLVHPALLEWLCGLLDPPSPTGEPPLWVVPRAGGHLQVLVSAVRPGLLPAVESYLASGRRDPRGLVERLMTSDPRQVIVVPEAEIAPFDPQMDSFRDLDTPEDLEWMGAFFARRGQR